MKRSIRVEGDSAFIPLTKGYEAAIEVADLSLVEGHNWTADVKLRSDGSVRTVYAYRKVAGVTVRLHCVLLPGSSGVDHKDGDGLNCRRKNLRHATTSQNGFNQKKRVTNRSGVKGVHWCRRERRWLAKIIAGGRPRFLGQFRCKTAAALAYAKASRELHGEFGRTG